MSSFSVDSDRSLSPSASFPLIAEELLAPLVQTHDEFDSVMGLTNRPKLPPQLKRPRISAANILSCKFRNSLPIQDRFNNQVYHMFHTAHSVFLRDLWNLPGKNSYHGVVIVRAVHHKTANLISNLKTICYLQHVAGNILSDVRTPDWTEHKRIVRGVPVESVR